jgi:hypothetical protein
MKELAMKEHRDFNVRAFVAAMIAFSGLGLPLTGIANHVYGFAPLTVARHAWMSAHNVLGLLFLMFSIWHVLLNRRVLCNHLKSASARVPAASREAWLAGALVAFMLLLFVGHAFHAGERFGGDGPSRVFEVR